MNVRFHKKAIFKSHLGFSCFSSKDKLNCEQVDPDNFQRSMALAAQGLSHFHLGFFHKDNSARIDDDDDQTTNESDSDSLYEYEEFDFELIIQNSLCLGLSQIPVIPEISDQTDFGDETEINSGQNVESNSTQTTDNASEIKTDQKDTSTNIDIVTNKPENGVPIECDIVSGAVELQSSVDNKKCEDSDDRTTITINKNEIILKRSFNDEYYSFGKQKRVLSKREKQEKRDNKRKVHRQVDPSEIGFDFCSSRRLILPSDVTLNASDDSTDESTKDGFEIVQSEIFVSNSHPPSSAVGTEHNLDQDNDKDVWHFNSETETNIQDDESFFAELGIDVNDRNMFHWEDCLDWDGTFFTPLKSKPKPAKSKSKKNKPRELTKDNNCNVICDSYIEFSTPHYRMSTHEQTLLFDLECNKSPKTYLRKDKDRKIVRLHKAVKTPHFMIKNTFNNPGRRKIHIHHRILKLTSTCIDFRTCNRLGLPAMPKTGVDLSVARAIRIKSPNVSSSQKRGAPKQSLRHVLDETNVPQALENDLASFLLSIQNRDLTPEDYEMLLRLDDTVKAKTVSKNIISSLKTDLVGDDIANILNCVICMEPYLLGQTRKFLPCGHDFHSDCIDSWLANSSQNCPLDGLPIDDS